MYPDISQHCKTRKVSALFSVLLEQGFLFPWSFSAFAAWDVARLFVFVQPCHPGLWISPPQYNGYPQLKTLNYFRIKLFDS